jgi:hypothetical protein
MDLVHSAYPEAEPTGFFPKENLQGEFPAARAQSSPATVLRDSLHSSHTISATSCVGAPKILEVVLGVKNSEKILILQGVGRAGRDRPQKLQSAKADMGVPRQPRSFPPGPCGIPWLAGTPGKPQTGRSGVKIRPGQLPHENPSKYVEMPALHPRFEIGAVFC